MRAGWPAGGAQGTASACSRTTGAAAEMQTIARAGLQRDGWIVEGFVVLGLGRADGGGGFSLLCFSGAEWQRSTIARGAGKGEVKSVGVRSEEKLVDEASQDNRTRLGDGRSRCWRRERNERRQ